MSNVPNPYELSRTLVKRGLAAEDARRAAVNSRQYPRYVVLTPNAVYHCDTLAEALERRGDDGVVYVSVAGSEGAGEEKGRAMSSPSGCASGAANYWSDQ